MSLRKIIREAVSDFLKESEDIGAVQQLISSMEENGIEFNVPEIDKENTFEPISVDITAKNDASPYAARVYMDYEVTKKRREEPAIWGNSVDSSRAPYSEPAEWKLNLVRVEVMDKEGNGDFYKGKDAFLKFFQDNYATFHNYFDDDISDILSENKNLKQFVLKEVMKFQKEATIEKGLDEVIANHNKIFNTEEISQKDAIEYLRDNLRGQVPFISIGSGALGNETIMVLASFEPKEEWAHGYVENSNYFRMSIEENGAMEIFTKSLYQKGQRASFETRLNVKTRKVTAKSLEDAKNKLIDIINKIKEYYK